MKFSIVYKFVCLVSMTAALVWVLWSCLPDDPEPNYKEGFKDEWCDFK